MSCHPLKDSGIFSDQDEKQLEGVEQRNVLINILTVSL